MRVMPRREREFVCGKLQAEIWEITAEEWRAATDQRELRCEINVRPGAGFPGSGLITHPIYDERPPMMDVMRRRVSCPFDL